MMRYKGYIGQVTYDHEAKIRHSDVVGLKDVITFEGTTIEEVEQAFRGSRLMFISICLNLTWDKSEGFLLHREPKGLSPRAKKADIPAALIFILALISLSISRPHDLHR